MKVKLVCLLALALAFTALSNTSHAIRIFFSQAGRTGAGQAGLQDPTANLTAIPTLNIDLSVNPNASIFVWARTDDPSADDTEKYTSLGLSIFAGTNPGTVEATAFALEIPTSPVRRWDATTDAMGLPNNPLPGTLGVGNAPDLVLNSTAFAIQRPGINNSGDTRETGLHVNSSSFYHGRLDLHALHAGTTNLFFRVGTALITQRDGDGSTQVFFGASTTAVSGVVANNMNPLSSPDLIINVIGGGPTNPVIDRNPATTAITRVGMSSQDIPTGAAAGSLLVQTWPTSFFDVFFDLNTAGEAALNDIIAAINTADTGGDPARAASGANDIGNGHDYDLRLTYAATPGQDQKIAWDFSSFAGASVISIAVPEPSTFALAGLGLLGLVGCVRRRRHA
jgi:hypothetical protein